MRIPLLKTIIIIAASLTAAFSGCAREVPLTDSVRFSVFGNTFPVSPFSGFTNSLEDVIADIESAKTTIVIHTGNAIYGGSESDGITGRDIKRQYGIFFSKMRNFYSVYYTIPGDKDLFNGTTSFYNEFSRRNSYYSFNYGSIHFIALDTTSGGADFIDSGQMKWLIKDLQYFSSSNAVFVLFNRPFIASKKKTNILPVPEDLHSVFKNHKVFAVISGGDKSYSNRKIDSISYISAGCGGFNDEKENRKTVQYYIMTYRNSELHIDPVHFNISKKN